MTPERYSALHWGQNIRALSLLQSENEADGRGLLLAKGRARLADTECAEGPIRSVSAPAEASVPFEGVIQIVA